jgi:hypothetical protein
VADATEGQSRRRFAVGALVALTLLHVGYRWRRGDLTPGHASKVSSLAVGSDVVNPEIPLAQGGAWGTGSLLLPVACQLVVVFDPSCPHCMAAAERERSVPATLRLPTTWVAPGDSLAAIRYLKLVGQGGRVGRSDRVWAMLGVHGVPAAFLIDGAGRVRQVWAYHGTEARESLEPLCAGTRTASLGDASTG